VKYLIVNADDFGINSGVNKGIIMAREAGAITNATLMIKREGAREAVDYALSNRSFSVGLHIDIDGVFPGNKKGHERFEKNYLRQVLQDPTVLKNIEKEILLQMELFEMSGLELSHIDSHHHLHALPEVFNIVLKAMEGSSLKTMRIARDYDLVKYPSIIWDEDFYRRAIKALHKKNILRADNFLSFSEASLAKEMPEGITELMTHPGKGEAWRQRELDFLLSDRWKALLDQNNVELVSFRDIAAIT